MRTTNVAVTGGTSTVEYLVAGSGPGLVLVHGTAVYSLTKAAGRWTVPRPRP